MRRTKKMLLAVTLLVALTGGTAVAAETIRCSDGGTCEGTRNDDVLVGSDERDTLLGKRGDDVLDGRGGEDQLRGEEGSDTLRGGDFDDFLEGDGFRQKRGFGDDTLFGGAGNDFMVALGGKDEYHGEEGDDFIDAMDRFRGGPGGPRGEDGPDVGKPGVDRVFGDDGFDTIMARDEKKDVIECGEGTDTVFFDPKLDEVDRDCEKRNPKPRGPGGPWTADEEPPVVMQ